MPGAGTALALFKTGALPSASLLTPLPAEVTAEATAVLPAAIVWAASLLGTGADAAASPAASASRGLLLGPSPWAAGRPCCRGCWRRARATARSASSRAAQAASSSSSTLTDGGTLGSQAAPPARPWPPPPRTTGAPPRRMAASALATALPPLLEAAGGLGFCAASSLAAALGAFVAFAAGLSSAADCWPACTAASCSFEAAGRR
mmetsp:Transcript_145040/g.404035  ORF Transcript_145040/g.404035 Transcript_145040/m.404035 type:complete len:205 (-) Transcript_145040:279-893(-)